MRSATRGVKLERILLLMCSSIISRQHFKDDDCATRLGSKASNWFVDFSCTVVSHSRAPSSRPQASGMSPWVHRPLCWSSKSPGHTSTSILRARSIWISWMEHSMILTVVLGWADYLRGLKDLNTEREQAQRPVSAEQVCIRLEPVPSGDHRQKNPYLRLMVYLWYSADTYRLAAWWEMLLIYSPENQTLCCSDDTKVEGSGKPAQRRTFGLLALNEIKSTAVPAVLWRCS